MLLLVLAIGSAAGATLPAGPAEPTANDTHALVTWGPINRVRNWIADRFRRPPSPTPFPTPFPTPHPTPVPTPFPTPNPTPPTPYPTPYPTTAEARKWLSTAPTPAPTRWHEAPGVELSGPGEYLAPVHDALSDRLLRLERLLESGVGDDRLGFCDDTYAKVNETKAEHAYVDKDPHAWAMNEVDSELDWLCNDWTPDKRKYIPSHVEAIKQVLATYEERITCHPGDVACNRGHVFGRKPHCACRCEAGWVGEACHERAAALLSTGRSAARGTRGVSFLSQDTP